MNRLALSSALIRAPLPPPRRGAPGQKGTPLRRRKYGGAADLTSAPLGSLNWSVSTSAAPSPCRSHRHRATFAAARPGSVPGVPEARRSGPRTSTCRRAGDRLQDRQRLRRRRCLRRLRACEQAFPATWAALLSQGRVASWPLACRPSSARIRACNGLGIVRHRALQLGGRRPYGELDRRQGALYRVWNLCAALSCGLRDRRPQGGVCDRSRARLRRGLRRGSRGGLSAARHRRAR
jgi:hypothetical protein